LDEADRSIHDALCVVRSLVKKRFMISGGGSPEAEMSLQLSQWAKTLTGIRSYCVRAFAEALEIIPYTLAENAGINPIQMVTELRNRHSAGISSAGINVKKGAISDMWAEKVVQPLLVNTSEIALATECVGMILKIGKSFRSIELRWCYIYKMSCLYCRRLDSGALRDFTWNHASLFVNHATCKS
jgi:T-complex protein 1 subunit delta